MMEKEQLLQKINDIFIDVLDDNTIVLNYETTAADVDGWESLTHVELVVAIEKALKIRFTSYEIQSWNNVGDMINSIIAKGV